MSSPNPYTSALPKAFQNGQYKGDVTVNPTNPNRLNSAVRPINPYAPVDVWAKFPASPSPLIPFCEIQQTLFYGLAFIGLSLQFICCCPSYQNVITFR